MELASTRPSCVSSGPAAVTSAVWNVQAGKVIQSIGTPYFHEELIQLLEITVPSDAFWIIRYAGEAVPDVVFTRGVSAQTQRVYSRDCAQIDPFSARWRREKVAGVFTLARLCASNPAYTLYSSIFLAAADMKDEMCIFLPITAHNCFAIFLERKHGLFVEREVRRLELVYPAIEGWCQAHLGWLFNDLRKPGRPGDIRLLNRPTIVFDHAGHPVYASEGWAKAIHRYPALKQQAAKLALSGDAELCLDGSVLRAERLNAEFPLAPNGSMLVLEKVSIAPSSLEASGSAAPFAAFTGRERDVLRRVLKGMRNEEISAELGVGVGSIRNLKFRLYRKSGVSSEGELVSRFLPFARLL